MKVRIKPSPKEWISQPDMRN